MVLWHPASEAHNTVGGRAGVCVCHAGGVMPPNTRTRRGAERSVGCVHGGEPAERIEVGAGAGERWVGADVALGGCS
eukprot:7118307-Prymnesium_polylepis.1